MLAVNGLIREGKKLVKQIEEYKWLYDELILYTVVF